MASPVTSPAPAAVPGRVQSIDVLRGLTVLLMLFVNDLPGVAGAPAWLKHIQPHDADGMTVPDFVFPAFLFIVGVSIPFGLEARLRRGASWASVWGHVLVRVVSLLVIGVFMVNSPHGGIFDPHLWCLLTYAGFVLVWNDWRGPAGRVRALRLAGAAVLLLAAVLYQGRGDTRAFIELRTSWWGILGLIGWAYLVGCAVYSLARREPAALLGAAAILYCVYLADYTGFFGGLWLGRWVDIGAMLGSNGGLVVSGTVLGMMLLPGSRLQTHRARMTWAVIYGAGLLIGAVLLHALHGVDKAFIYNKIMATPPTALLVAGLTTWVWVAVYAVVDARGWHGWTRWVAPTGRNALFIFILGPILYHLMWWSPTILGGFEPHSALASPTALGMARAVGFTALVAWLAQALRRVGVVMKL